MANEKRRNKKKKTHRQFTMWLLIDALISCSFLCFWSFSLMPTVSALASSSSSSFLAPSEVNTCDISEFRCPSKDGQGTLCLPMDRWCNGKDECDNRVDEPRSCTSQYNISTFHIYSYNI